MKKMITKLRSSAGESIGETLIALLISALALMMLAGMISSTTNLVKKSETTMNNYYEKYEQLARIPAGSPSVVVNIQIAKTNDSGNVVSGSESAVRNINILYLEQTALGNRKVTAFGYNKTS